MRKVQTFEDKPHAEAVSAYLTSLGIENLVQSNGANHDIWIYDEDLLEEGRRRIKAFTANPEKAKRAAARRQRAESKQAASPRPRRTPPGSPLDTPRIAPVTTVLVTISVLVYIAAYTAWGSFVYRLFQIASTTTPPLEEVAKGQIWRLITPIFLHGSPLHILFNLLWLHQLGTLIESKESSRLLLMQVLTIAVGSNLVQFWASGPNFGGMSGVVYGLFGYLWIRSRFDPWSGYYVHSGVVYLMLTWLVLCFTGVLGPIANAAHLTGLVLGGIWSLTLSNRPKKS